MSQLPKIKACRTAADSKERSLSRGGTFPTGGILNLNPNPKGQHPQFSVMCEGHRNDSQMLACFLLDFSTAFFNYQKGTGLGGSTSFRPVLGLPITLPLENNKSPVFPAQSPVGYYILPAGAEEKKGAALHCDSETKQRALEPACAKNAGLLRLSVG